MYLIWPYIEIQGIGMCVNFVANRSVAQKAWLRRTDYRGLPRPNGTVTSDVSLYIPYYDTHLTIGRRTLF